MLINDLLFDRFTLCVTLSIPIHMCLVLSIDRGFSKFLLNLYDISVIPGQRISI